MSVFKFIKYYYYIIIPKTTIIITIIITRGYRKGFKNLRFMFFNKIVAFQSN